MTFLRLYSLLPNKNYAAYEDLLIKLIELCNVQKFRI